MSETVFQVFPTAGDLQRAASDLVASILRENASQGRLMVALSGGSTPRNMHLHLVEQPGIDWSLVHLFWGDERPVPHHHEDSNYRMAHESLIQHLPIPASQVHRVPTEYGPQQAAERYEREIRESFGIDDKAIPRFDLVILGMGADGHTASLFPGTKALAERKHLVVANEVPQLRTTRITLTYPVLNAARNVVFLVAGKDKSAALERVRSGHVTGDDTPAAFVRPEQGRLYWLVDQAAANER